MKWLKRLCKGLVIVAAIITWAAIHPSVTTHASPTTDVTIYATPLDFGPPTNFKAVEATKTQADLTWDKGAGADKTLIKGSYGTPPPTMGDGYQVYYGVGVSASDGSVDFENNTGTIYYRAWSQKADGTWSTGYADASPGGNTMMFLALIIAALGLMVASYALHNRMLAIVGAAFWALLGIYAFTTASGQDIYFWTGFLCVFMVMVAVWEAYDMKPKRDIQVTMDRNGVKEVRVKLPEDEDDVDEEDIQEQKYLVERLRRQRDVSGTSKAKQLHEDKKWKHFDKTGEV